MHIKLDGMPTEELANLLDPPPPKLMVFEQVVPAELATVGTLRNRIMNLDGRSFERLICNMLERLNFKVAWSSPGKDGGIDITARLAGPLHGGKYIIQCKRYKEDTKIGRPTLQEFIGAAHGDKEHPRLIFVTTSSFTREAVGYASATGIQLIDGNVLEGLVIDADIP